MRILSKLIKLFWVFMLLLPVSCSLNEERPGVIGADDNSLTEILFHPCLDDVPASKAIGDASEIDQLRVGVYKKTSKGVLRTDFMTILWEDAQREGVILKLDGTDAYSIVFWAENKDNTAYHLNEDGLVQADYSDYSNSGFSRMEELDAFYATFDVVPGNAQPSQKIILRRPFSQLNFADKRRPHRGVQTAKVIFHSAPVSFNPLTGSINATDSSDDSDDVTFTFTDFPSESLIHNGTDYYYISCNYLFAPSDGISNVECTVELEENGRTVTRHEFRDEEAISISQRQKVNMIDYMVPEPAKWSIWNGSFSKISTITVDPSDPDCYIIDEAEDIAWLSDSYNAGSLGKGKTFRLVTNIDMAGKPAQKSLKLPEGSTFDGNGFTVKGIKMMVGLFGDVATELSIKNLVVENAVVESTTRGNKGVLANTLRGSCRISNVLVLNSSVRAVGGAAGGMVGYLCRKDKSNRSESLSVVFDNCHIVNTVIEAEGKEGCFVGMFRGYDNGEELVFKDNCSYAPMEGAEPLDSYIIEGNEAVWMSGNDYTRYNAWLGCEECYRGKVYFEDARYVAKWDGITQVTPLSADPLYDDSPEHKVTAGKRRYMIYSPFDLAGARKSTSMPNALYFKESVDMNGQGKDGLYNVPEEFERSKCKSEDDNWFKGFTAVINLDGQNNTIYNLCLNSRAVSDTAHLSAFIRTNPKDSVSIHKNLIFRNCCSVSPVITKKYTGVVQDMSGGAIFLDSTGGQIKGSPTYTMDNIHIYDSQVFALQHSGVLAGICTRGNVSNCSVNNCYIENYKCTKSLEPFSKEIDLGAGNILISTGFYSYGEIGALLGNVRGESTISNCHVRNTTVHAYGQADKEADMTADGLLGKAAVATAKGMGYFVVPGRHVSTMIGSIRTHYGEKITITDCTVDAATKCTAEHYKHNNAFPYIGEAYYISFLDEEGKVVVNGQTLTLADGNRKTIR